VIGRIRETWEGAKRGKVSSMAILAWLADALGLKFTRNWLLMCIGLRAARKFEDNDALATLERLARLRESGTLSEAEFRTMKARLLAKP
jgi:hypothetical protein